MNSTSHHHFDAVLFDLDGTLVETAPELADAANDCLAELGFPPVARSELRHWIGHGIRELMVQAVANHTGETPEHVRAGTFLDAAVQRFEGHYALRCGTSSTLFPRVREALESLRAGGVRLAVVTNKNQRFTRLVLDAHGLTPYFEMVVCGDSFPLKKPDPTGVQACLDFFGVSRQRTLFVGDSHIDVDTARAAGIAVWAVPYGYNLGQPIEATAPDRVIADFSVFETWPDSNAETTSTRARVL